MPKTKPRLILAACKDTSNPAGRLVQGRSGDSTAPSCTRTGAGAPSGLQTYGTLEVAALHTPAAASSHRRAELLQHACRRENTSAMAAHEETTQRAVFVDTSNEPRTDEEAVAMCTRGLEKATSRQDIADLQFRLANAQVRRGFPELAETAFRACVAADPRRIDAFNNLGLLLLRRYDYGAAATEFRNGLAVSESAELLLNLGVAVEHAGHLDEARRCYQRVIEVAPNDSRPHANLGALAAKQGELQDAVACHRKAVALNSDDPWLSFNLGDALEDAGDDDGAVRAYEASISLPCVSTFSAGLVTAANTSRRVPSSSGEPSFFPASTRGPPFFPASTPG